MKKHVEQLFKLSNKPVKKILGLMSGTSLDGLDMALCEIENSGLQTRIRLTHFETVAFGEDFKQEIKSIFSKQEINFEKLCLLNPWVARQHAAIINQTLRKWKIPNQEIDLLASHGQTVYHAPLGLHGKTNFGNATLQIGDGDHLAVATGIITVSDFRQKHIAAGGEGAPLAVYGDHLIFGKQGEDRVLLNIGGIANFTYLPGDRDAAKIFSTDTGPGNTMMDAFIQLHFPGNHFDQDARLARKGTISEPLLAALRTHDFFQQSFPKTTGPELFNLQYLSAAMDRSGTSSISPEDCMATLNRFSAVTIADSLLPILATKGTFRIFLSGGGMHNPQLVEHLQRLLPGSSFSTTEELGIDPDAKEAVLFAVLANECVCGDADYLQSGIDGMPAVTMGKISFPS
ncbi:MAG: anhydro-N-acetylmuramic acid kinase [Ferruginibacter sp.]